MSFAWPIWRAPASFTAIRALLWHPELRRPGALDRLGVNHVRVSRRISLERYRNFTAPSRSWRGIAEAGGSSAWIAASLAKHGMDHVDAMGVFDDPRMVSIPDPGSYGGDPLPGHRHPSRVEFCLWCTPWHAADAERICRASD